MNKGPPVWFVGQDMASNEEAYDHYRTQFDAFKLATNRILLVSYGTSFVKPTHQRESLCAILCMKLSVTARSLYLLAPDPISETFLQSHLDFSSSAALARLLVNTFASLYHLGIEPCSEDEFEVRQLLVFWRDFRVRRKMNFGVDSDKAAAFHEPNLRTRLESNGFWMSLPAQARRHILKGNLLLHSEEDIVERAGMNRDFHKQMYAYWSAHTHCDSVAFLDMAENRRGSGQINAGDIAMLAVSLEWVIKFLKLASDQVDEIFAGAESRAASVPNIDLLSNKIFAVPWAGLSLSEARARRPGHT